METGFIEVDGKKVKIEMFLGGDYKFLLMVMGLSGATSTRACLWCLIHKLDRWDTSKSIEHYQSVEMKRTLAHIKSMLPLTLFHPTSHICDDKYRWKDLSRRVLIKLNLSLEKCLPLEKCVFRCFQCNFDRFELGFRYFH